MGLPVHSATTAATVFPIVVLVSGCAAPFTNAALPSMMQPTGHGHGLLVNQPSPLGKQDLGSSPAKNRMGEIGNATGHKKAVRDISGPHSKTWRPFERFMGSVLFHLDLPMSLELGRAALLRRPTRFMESLHAPRTGAPWEHEPVRVPRSRGLGHLSFSAKPRKHRTQRGGSWKARTPKKARIGTMNRT
jgi:hypothetical protein